MSDAQPIDPWLLSVLVCPVTRTALRLDADARELISDHAALAYPIRNGVAVMLADQARDLAGSA